MKKNRMFFIILFLVMTLVGAAWAEESATHSASFASDRRGQTPDAGASKAVNRSRFQPGSIAAPGIVEYALGRKWH